MKIPAEFSELSGYIGGFSHIEEDAPEQWVRSAVRQFAHTFPSKEHADAVARFPTRDPGYMYENPETQEQVRIMERPRREPFRKEPLQKFHNDYYYRYRRKGGVWGSHVTIPSKPQ